MLLLRLSQGISSGCHHATRTPFFVFVIIAGRGIMFLLRLSQGISSGCNHATPTPFFICHCGKGALSFCFDLAKYFYRMPQCHRYTPQIFYFSPDNYKFLPRMTSVLAPLNITHTEVFLPPCFWLHVFLTNIICHFLSARLSHI